MSSIVGQSWITTMMSTFVMEKTHFHIENPTMQEALKNVMETYMQIVTRYSMLVTHSQKKSLQQQVNQITRKTRMKFTKVLTLTHILFATHSQSRLQNPLLARSACQESTSNTYVNHYDQAKQVDKISPLHLFGWTIACTRVLD